MQLIVVCTIFQKLKIKLKLPQMKKYCLITGAASGIGLEFAKMLIKDHYCLVLIDLNWRKLVKIKETLGAEYNEEVIILKYDLCVPGIAQKIYNEIKKMKIVVDIIINNAGYGIFGLFHEIAWEKQFSLIQLTVVTNTHLTKLFLNDMLSRNRGKILNVSSIAAFQPGPLMSIYYASKTYLLSFGRAISNELKGTNVTLTTLCPGMTKTMFQKRNGNLNPSFGFLCASPEYVALYGYRALKKGKSVAIPCFYNRIISNIHRFLPLEFATNLSRAIQERNRIKHNHSILT